MEKEKCFRCGSTDDVNGGLCKKCRDDDQQHQDTMMNAALMAAMTAAMTVACL